MEGAARVFASDFNSATLLVPGSEAQSPAWVVTPGGAWCRLLYLAGALTEVSESGDLLHCRLADHNRAPVRQQFAQRRLLRGGRYIG